MVYWIKERSACQYAFWGITSRRTASPLPIHILPVLNALEARILAANAAEYGCPLLKTDTPITEPEGHVFFLIKNIHGTKQATRSWHLHIWMDGEN
jgi:hypothetical protein